MLKALILPLGLLLCFVLAYCFSGQFLSPADDVIHGIMTIGIGFPVFLVVFGFATPGFDLPEPTRTAN